MLSSLLSFWLASAPAVGAGPTLVDVSVFAPYAVQPGLRLGAAVPLLSSQGSHRHHGLLLGPRVGWFHRPGNHHSLLAQLELRYRTHHPDKAVAHGVVLGVGYLGSSQITSESIDLATGDKSFTRESRHGVLPTLAYELTPRLGDGKELLFRVEGGYRLMPAAGNQTWLGIELGLRFGGGEV